MIVGADAGLVADLHEAGWRAASGGPPDLVVITDPRARPEDLPRNPMRIGLVAPGEGARWRSGRLLDDLDAALVSTAADQRRVDPATIAPPVRLHGAVGRRITEVVDLLEARPRVHVVTSVSRLQARHRWGDHHYAIGLARALHAGGWWPRIWCQEEADSVDHGAAALVVLLAGNLALTAIPGVPTVAWVISHPERLDGLTTETASNLAGLLVASRAEVARLVARGIAASELPQATDPTRFQPTPGGPAHDLLFVANSRGQRRKVLTDLLPTDRELAVYGRDWTPDLLDPVHLVADHVPNVDLPALYSAADIVLNDHWDEMRARGFASNRIADAGACGALVVSDHVEGIDELFDGGVVTFSDRRTLEAALAELAADPAGAARRASHLRRVVLERHTFEARISALTAASVMAPGSSNTWPGIRDAVPPPDASEGARFVALVDAPRPPEPFSRDDVIAELASAAEDAASQRNAVLAADHDLARTRGRRSVKLLDAVRRPSPQRIRRALRPTAIGPPPATVDAQRAADEVHRRYRRTDLRRLTTPQVSAPAWRVGHLGGVQRFAGVTEQVPLESEDWETALADGLDLVLIEPAPGWRAPRHMERLLLRSRDLGVPTVLLTATDATGDADDADNGVPAGAVDHVLTEGPGPHDLPLGVAVDRWNPRGWRSAGPDPLLCAPTHLPAIDRRALAAIFPSPRVLRGPVLGDEVPPAGGPLDDAAPPETPVTSPAELVRALRGAGVLLDDARWHRSPVAAARLRLAALALGVPVVAVGDDLGVPHAMVAPDLEAAAERAHALLADADLRERVSITARRTILTEHGDDARFGALCRAIGAPSPRAPLVSVVVSTNRPELVDHARHSVARQRYPHLELVLVLHGEGHAPDDPPPPRDEVPLTVVRAPGSWTLGDCLNAGIAVSRGDLVAKMDDDDEYGPHHLTDLVVAQRHSHADVVGKRVEFIHLAGRGLTLRRSATTPERFRSHVSGPSLLLTAQVARAVGFRRLPRRVDTTLCAQVTALGGRVYRTHSRDLVLVRHRDGHTWDVDETELLDRAVEQRPGDGTAWASSEVPDGDWVSEREERRAR